MQIEDKVFKHKQFNTERLLEYGFTSSGGQDAGSCDMLLYKMDFLDGEFRAIITVDMATGITGAVIDNMSGEEYDPLRNENYNGAFVGNVRQAYEELLTDIADHCCSDVLFASDQANRIAGIILDRYGVSPDFPWDSDSNADSGVFRHQDSSKWFGLIMNIRREQLQAKNNSTAAKGRGRSGESDDDHSPSKERVDVINLKKDPAKSVMLAGTVGVYPAFHMNHKLWISVILDDTLPDEDVMQLIDDSYHLTGKKRASGISEDIIQRVLILADSVPPGQVVTYGQIAAEAGIPGNARMVGKIMSMADRYGDHPCHRVVAHNGRLVPGWKEQRLLLEAEGVTFMSNGCVNMQRHNIP